MDVGHGCIINDRWIPRGMDTGLIDINGKSIKTANKVKLNGCSSTTAIVGKNETRFMLYFGSENGSVGWFLNEKSIKQHSIKVIE